MRVSLSNGFDFLDFQRNTWCHLHAPLSLPHTAVAAARSRWLNESNHRRGCRRLFLPRETGNLAVFTYVWSCRRPFDKIVVNTAGGISVPSQNDRREARHPSSFRGRSKREQHRFYIVYYMTCTSLYRTWSDRDSRKWIGLNRCKSRSTNRCWRNQSIYKIKKKKICII